MLERQHFQKNKLYKMASQSFPTMIKSNFFKLVTITEQFISSMNIIVFISSETYNKNNNNLYLRGAR